MPLDALGGAFFTAIDYHTSVAKANLNISLRTYLNTSMGGLLGTLIIGFIAGFVAKSFMPGDDASSPLAMMALGVVGAFVGNAAGRAMGIYTYGLVAELITAIVGALLVLFVFRALKAR